MARTHSGASQKIPPKDRGKYKGAYKTTLQRYTINQTEKGGPQSDSAITPRDPNEEKKSNLSQGHRVL